MQKTLMFEMPESIINKIMDKNEDFKMWVKIEFKNLKKSFLTYFIFGLSGKRNKNRITFFLDDKNIDNCMAKYLGKEDYTVYFSYELHNEDERFAPEKENNFSIEKDNDFYFVKIDAEGKQVFSKGFKDENEFEKQKDNFKEINEKIDFRNKKIIERNYFNRLVGNYADLFLKLVIFSSFFVIATFIILGLFTGGVAPAILTPLIAKCLIGVLGGIGVLGFLASLLVYSKGKTLEKSINLAQDDIDNLQNEINDLGKKDNELDNNEKNNNEPEMLKDENEKDNENEH